MFYKAKSALLFACCSFAKKLGNSIPLFQPSYAIGFCFLNDPGYSTNTSLQWMQELLIQTTYRDQRRLVNDWISQWTRQFFRVIFVNVCQNISWVKVRLAEEWREGGVGNILTSKLTIQFIFLSMLSSAVITFLERESTYEKWVRSKPFGVCRDFVWEASTCGEVVQEVSLWSNW